MNFSKGDILQIPEGKFTKVIYVKNGVYGISGWTFSRRGAEKGNTAFKRINKFGMRNLGAKKVSSDEPVEKDEMPEREDKYTKSQLNGMLKDEVVEIAEELGFKKSGTKKEVIERIIENQ